MVDTLLRLERLVNDHAAQNPREGRGRGASSDEWRMLRDWRPEIETLLADGWRLTVIAAVLPGVTGAAVTYDDAARYLRVARNEAGTTRAPDPDRLERLRRAVAESGKSPSIAGVVRRYASEIMNLLARGFDSEAIAAALTKETGVRINKYRMTRIIAEVSQIGPRRSTLSGNGETPEDRRVVREPSFDEVSRPTEGGHQPQARQASMSAELFAAVGPLPAAANGVLDAEMEEIKRRLDEKLASDPARQPSEQTKAMLAEIEKLTSGDRR